LTIEISFYNIQLGVEGMKYTKLIAGVGIVIVAGAVLYGVYGKNLIKPSSVNQDQNLTVTKSKTTDTVTPNGAYTINELLVMNRPMKCTWKDKAAGDSDVTNIIYINGKKFYQDVAMGDIGHSFTISDGDNLYIWNDFNDMASKMKYTDMKISPQPGKEKIQGNTDAEQKKDFVCEEWNVDGSVFNPPQDKNFKDVTDEMSEAFQKMGENGDLENSKQQICDMCKNAPDQTIIDECLKNAGCE
jgi:hypothetical protein